jgi:predicted signal transduction protein with EAL and GGDEF domain
VETLAQLDALRLSGCDSVQGYLLSRPTPGEQVPAMLAAARGLAAGLAPAPRALTTSAHRLRTTPAGIKSTTESSISTSALVFRLSS